MYGYFLELSESLVNNIEADDAASEADRDYYFHQTSAHVQMGLVR
jgi:hypothetical protein